MHTHFLAALSASAFALSHAAPTSGGFSAAHGVSHMYGPDSKCFHYYFDHLGEYKHKYWCKDYEQYKGSYDDAYYAKKKAEQDKKNSECKKQDYDFQKHTSRYLSLKNSFEEEEKKYNAVYKQYNFETTKYEEHKRNYEAFKRAREEENRKNEETKKYCEKMFDEVKEYFKPKQSYQIDGHKNSHSGANKGDGKGFAGKKDEKCDEDKKDGGHGGDKKVGGKDGGHGSDKEGKDGKLDGKEGHDGKAGHDGKDVYLHGNKNDGMYDDHRTFGMHDGENSKFDGRKGEKCDDDKKGFGNGANRKGQW